MDIFDQVIPKIGERIGRYDLTAELGRGGFGVVYRARQSGLDVDVAIKVMIPQFSESAKKFQLYKRFEQEAKVMKQLEHPNTIKVRDYGRTEHGLPYLVMEFARGRTVGEMLQQGPIPVARVMRIAKQVLGSLAEAHHQGIVHRDLKPDNIMVRDIHGEPDSVKVFDFGIAKILDETSDVQTMTGARFGTPGFMAPEQAQGIKMVDGRLDQYALGLILAECISGRRVVRADDPMAAIFIQASPKPLEFEPAVTDSPLFPVIWRATAKDPNVRYPDALAMRDAIIEVEKELEIPAPPRPSGQMTVGQSNTSGGPRATTPMPPSEPPLPLTTPFPPSHPEIASMRATTPLPPEGTTSRSISSWLIGLGAFVGLLGGVLVTVLVISNDGTEGQAIEPGSKTDDPAVVERSEDSSGAALSEDSTVSPIGEGGAHGTQATLHPLDFTATDGTVLRLVDGEAPFYFADREINVGQLGQCLSEDSCATAVEEGCRTHDDSDSCNYGNADIDESLAVNCLSQPAGEAYCQHFDMRLPTDEEWDVAVAGLNPESSLWQWTSTVLSSDPERRVVRGGPEDLDGPSDVDPARRSGNVRYWATPPYIGVRCVMDVSD